MDRMMSSGFDNIAQKLFEQKKLMDALEAENRRLRFQLADLQRGIGITVVIEGKTIPLAYEREFIKAQSTTAMQSLQNLPHTPPPSTQLNIQHTYNTPSNAGQSAAPNGDKPNANLRNQLSDSLIL